MYDQFLPLILFGIATAFSPGPNNIMSSYSGFNFGFKKTIPLMLGVIFWMDNLINFDGFRINCYLSEIYIFIRYN